MNDSTARPALPAPIQTKIEEFCIELLIYSPRQKFALWINSILGSLLIIHGFLIFVLKKQWAAEDVFPLVVLMLMLNRYICMDIRPRARKLKQTAKDLQGLFDREDNPKAFDLVEAVSKWR